MKSIALAIITIFTQVSMAEAAPGRIGLTGTGWGITKTDAFGSKGSYEKSKDIAKKNLEAKFTVLCSEQYDGEVSNIRFNNITSSEKEQGVSKYVTTVYTVKVDGTAICSWE